MSGKPSWMPQDDWNRIEKGVREEERRKADLATVYIAEELAAGKAKQVDPRVAAVRKAKDRAIDKQDFEAAARLRDEEKRLSGEK